MGRVDVDAMLEELTPEQLIEWRAAIEVEGCDDVQRQVAKLTAMFVTCMSSFGGEKADEVTPEQMMELLDMKEAVAPKVEWQSGEELYAKLKQQFG